MTISRRSGTRYPAITGVAIVVSLVLAGCDVPTNDEPQAIASDAVPYGLLSTTTTTTTTTVPAPVEVRKELFLVERVDERNRLRAVVRSFEAGAAATRDVIRRLLRDDVVTNDETALGLSSAIPESAELVRFDLDDDTGVATITVAGIFEELQGDLLRVALAQIVYTATGDVEVRAVTFRNADDEVVEALIDGSESAAVVNRSDYSSVAPG